MLVVASVIRITDAPRVEIRIPLGSCTARDDGRPLEVSLCLICSVRYGTATNDNSYQSHNCESAQQSRARSVAHVLTGDLAVERNSSNRNRGAWRRTPDIHPFVADSAC